MAKFLRRTSNRYSKLGLRRKKKQIWRKPTGRDNKMREKRKGYPAIVSVGYKNSKIVSGKLNGKNPILVYNVSDLNKIKKNEIPIIGSIGEKKKIEIAKKAKEKNIKIYNLNPLLFLKKSKLKKEKKEKKSTSKHKENKNELK